jgi:hypothetical protein
VEAADKIARRTRTLARALSEFSDISDVPHPDEPGVRVVGFTYLEAQADFIEAIRAMIFVRDAFRKDKPD